MISRGNSFDGNSSVMKDLFCSFFSLSALNISLLRRHMIGELSGDGSYIVAPQNRILSKGNGKLHFKGLYDYNEIMRQRIQH